MMPSLRDYQEEMKYHTHRFFDNPDNNRLMVVSPTGTGKTTYFSSMVADHFQAGEKTLIVVHRIELVDQIVERLKQFSIEAGVIASGYPKQDYLQVQVGMVQGQESLQEFKAERVYIDECHHSTASTYQKIFEWFPNAKKVGVTATPVRLDGKGFDTTYQEMLNLYPISYFFENNYLVPPKHYFCANIPQEALKEKVYHGDYDLAEMAKYMIQNKLIADVVKSYQRYAMGRKAVVFACNIEHSKKVVDEFNNVGIPAAHLDGTIDKEERRKMISDFRKGKILILSNYDIISEGFDVPDIEACILAKRTKSLSTYVQSVGRCLRPDKASGKQYGIILDCSGQWLEHGFAGINYNWTLTGKEDEILEPLIKTRLFRKVKERIEPINKYPDELENAELISLGEDLQRLAMFDKFVSQYPAEKMDEAVKEYADYLMIQGFDLSQTEKSYIVNRLDTVGGHLTEHFWSSHFNCV